MKKKIITLFVLGLIGFATWMFAQTYSHYGSNPCNPNPCEMDPCMNACAENPCVYPYTEPCANACKAKDSTMTKKNACQPCNPCKKNNSKGN